MYCLAVFSLTETWTQKSHLDLDFLTFYTMFNSVNTTLMEFQFESNARMIRPLTLPPCAYIIAYFLHSLVSLLIHVFAFHRVCYSSCRCVFTNLFEWKVLLYVYFLKRWTFLLCRTCSHLENFLLQIECNKVYAQINLGCKPGF